jgi:C-terminal processing protease CtpA/Prc
LFTHWGAYRPGVQTRFIESHTVVTQVLDRFAFGADIRAGDVILDIDGVAASDKREALRPYLSASNESALQRQIDAFLLRTNGTSIALGVSRFGIRQTVRLSAVAVTAVLAEITAQDGRGAKWKLLDGNIGYVHMGRLQQADVAAMMSELWNTRAIVFDVRNYPNGTLYLIAQQLNPEARKFVDFTAPNYAQPGTLVKLEGARAGPAAPSSNYYRGKVILLADERTQSHAEFTLMALKTAPDVTLVGSETAGADGNVSAIALPGGLQTNISGLGVLFPDGTNTQRLGIVPDLVVRPTIAGIQAGRDEVLERALALVP